MGQLFFFMRNPNKKFQNSSIHGSKVMLCIKKRDKWKEGWTNNPEAICPSNFFEVGGIKIKCELEMITLREIYLSNILLPWLWQTFGYPQWNEYTLRSGNTVLSPLKGRICSQGQDSQEGRRNAQKWFPFKEYRSKSTIHLISLLHLYYNL